MEKIYTALSALNIEFDTKGIIKLGYKAKELAAENNRAVIHSIFENTINLLYDEDYIVGVLNENYICTTQSIIVTKDFFRQLKGLSLNTGMCAAISFKEPVSSKAVVDLTIPDNINYITINDIKNNILVCLDYIEKECQESIFVCYLAGIKTLYTDLLEKKLENIGMYIKNNSISGLYESLKNILGLGQGLTPAGDDFIYGFLSAFFYGYKYMNYDNSTLMHLSESLAQKAKLTTTSISYNMLRSCCSGEFNEAVRQFAVQVLSSHNAVKGMNEILRIGSTSGADSAAGMLYGFKMLFFKEEKNGF